MRDLTSFDSIKSKRGDAVSQETLRPIGRLRKPSLTLLSGGVTVSRRVCLLSNRTLTTLALSQLLISHKFDVCCLAATGEAIATLADTRNPDNLILDDPDSDITLINQVRSYFPTQPILLICDHPTPDLINTCFEANLSGPIDESIGPDEIIRFVELTAAGHAVMTRATVNTLIHQKRIGLDGEAQRIVDQMSAKEITILLQMAEGASNKEIARTLNVSETTIKSHVKSVLTKLHVSNRTRAAIWCHRHRLDEHFPPDIPAPAIRPAAEQQSGAA